MVRCCLIQHLHGSVYAWFGVAQFSICMVRFMPGSVLLNSASAWFGLCLVRCCSIQHLHGSVYAQEALTDRKDASSSSMTARPAPSLARDALLFGQGFPRFNYISTAFVTKTRLYFKFISIAFITANPLML
jgi:hypothetical protein